jgi:acetyl esterase/lipase
MQTITLPLTNANVTLTAYLLEASTEMPNAQVRPAVLICPGGGYFFCSAREAEPIAMAFLAEGYHAFILRYSLKENAAFPRPLNDAEEALELIRARAAEWQVDPGKIAACGFSAGGHLAAALGTLGRTRPNALVLAYPCILDSMSAKLAVPVPSLEKAVDEHTPPTFLFANFADTVVPVENSLQFALALEKARVPFELHVFQNGVHGLALATPLTSSGYTLMVDADVAQWFGLAMRWLAHQFQPFPVEKTGGLE